MMYAERQMSPRALQIAEAKPKFWEYELTAVLVRDWVGPIERRYNDLQKGLYALPRKVVPGAEFLDWMSSQLEAIGDQTRALSTLVNDELGPSWGPPGQPGSVEEIKRVCSYIADACGRLLEWEELMRSIRTDEAFSEMLGLFPGVAGINIAEVMKISAFVEEVVSSGPGSYEFCITIAFPEGWDERFQIALERLKESIGIED